MYKRGQVTVFIALGILILGIVLGMIYVSQYLAREKLEVEEEKAKEAALMGEPVKMFVEGCLESTAKDSLLSIGKQGGYHDLSDKPIDSFFFNIIPYIMEDNTTSITTVFSPYYFKEGTSNFPELEVIENELSKSIETKLPECIDEFKVFEEQGYNFILGSHSVNTVIASKSVILNLEYPIEVKKEMFSSTLDSFSRAVKFNFKEKYSLINQLMEEQEEEPNYLPLGFLTNLAYENDFTFELIHFEEPVVQFNLIFEEEVFEFPYIYSFMFWYDWPASEEETLEEGEVTFSGEESLSPVNSEMKYKEQSIILFAEGEATEQPENLEDWREYAVGLETQDLANEMLNNPDIAAHLEFFDFQRGIWEINNRMESDSSYFDKNKGNLESLLDEVDIRARDEYHISLLNDNYHIMKGWIDKYGKGISLQTVTMEGKKIWPKIKSYDGKTIITEGTDSTTFNIAEHPKARVLVTGKLIRADGSEIVGGVVAVDSKTGEVSVKGEKAILDLSNVKKGSFVCYKGTVLMGEHALFHTNDPRGVKVVIDKGKITIEGQDVALKRPNMDDVETYRLPMGDKLVSFTGSIILHEDFIKTGHMTFKEGAAVTFFSKTDQPSIDYTVFDDVEYYERPDMCAAASLEGRNCIGIDLSQKYLQVRLEKDSRIDIEAYDESIKKVEVPWIEKGAVNFNYQDKVSLQFTKDPVKVLQGDISEFDGTINTYFENPAGLICGQRIGEGIGQGCMSKLEYKNIQLAEDYMKAHQALIDVRGYGKFFGGEWGKRHGKWLKRFEEVPKEINCIGYETQVLSKTIKETSPELANEFLAFIEKEGRANFIYKWLVEKAGWEAIYFNPNTRQIKEDLSAYMMEPDMTEEEIERIEEKEKRIQWAISRKKATYGVGDSAVPITEKAVNYRGKLPPWMEKIRQGYGTYDQGIHAWTFLGKGIINPEKAIFAEVHWSKGPKSKNLFEMSNFESKMRWQSGIIVVPPGAIERAKAEAIAEAWAEAEEEESGSSG